MRRVTVLYEDQLSDDVTSYGLHELVKQCVADRLGVPRHGDLRTCLIGIPKKGSSKLRNECRTRLDKITADGRSVVAVYDSDKILKLVTPEAPGCKKQIGVALKEGCQPTERLEVVLLVANTESVIQSVGHHTPPVVTLDELKRAVQQKDRSTRDKILNRAAAEQNLPVRATLLGAMPSFAYPVDKLVTLLQ